MCTYKNMLDKIYDTILFLLKMDSSLMQYIPATVSPPRTSSYNLIIILNNYMECSLSFLLIYSSNLFVYILLKLYPVQAFLSILISVIHKSLYLGSLPRHSTTESDGMRNYKLKFNVNQIFLDQICTNPKMK